MTRICRVMVVEDDDAVRRLLGNVFDDEGYRFTLVRNGVEMRSALRRDSYDVAVIDVSRRGGEDGIELAELADEYGCGVILTAVDPAHGPGTSGGEWAFLEKPFRIQEMIALVDKVLKETKARCSRRPRRSETGLPLTT